MAAAGRIWLSTGFYGCFLLLTGMALLAGPVAFWYLRWGKKYTPAVAVRTIIWFYGWLWTRIFMTFTPVTVRGCDRKFPEPCIITPNHQSFFDSYCIGFVPVTNLVFVVRAWPFKIPFYHWYMRKAEYINSEEMSGGEVLAKARQAIASGASLVVFPEGTRSRTGELGRFHSGAFSLAVACNVPVLPLCLDSTGRFLRRGEYFPRKSEVRVTALDPVYPEAFLAHGDAAHMAMRREVKRRMQAVLDAGQGSTEKLCR